MEQELYPLNLGRPWYRNCILCIFSSLNRNCILCIYSSWNRNCILCIYSSWNGNCILCIYSSWNGNCILCIYSSWNRNCILCIQVDHGTGRIVLPAEGFNMLEKLCYILDEIKYIFVEKPKFQGKVIEIHNDTYGFRYLEIKVHFLNGMIRRICP